jgi:tRNA (guanine-N(7)-)-methyltransferase subunit TRM82
MMVLPYHLIKVCGNTVFAAQGSDIHSFNSALEYVSTWKYPVQQTDESNGPSAEAQESPAQEEPPTKRRKVEPGQEEGPKGRRAKSTNGQPKNNKSAKYDVPGNERPFIQGLYATTDGRHLVAITGSDKTIWVFEHDGAGNLKQLSQRQVYP